MEPLGLAKFLPDWWAEQEEVEEDQLDELRAKANTIFGQLGGPEPSGG